MKFIIRRSDFNEVFPVWRDHLWPQRSSPIEPVSAIKKGGGFDLSLMKAAPIFFAAISPENSGEKLVGVISGFRTSIDEFRLRGLFVDPSMRRSNIASTLCERLATFASEQNCKVMWTMPRQSAWPFYQALGFRQTSDWFSEGVEFGPNCFAEISIASLLPNQHESRKIPGAIIKIK